jgi:RNA polymerase sigma factor (sigma-70 family)
MFDVTALLAEADWLSRLARSLVGNDDADDIVQETYVAALRTPPDPDRAPRPWLRRVMVNVVRMRHRGRVRRDARETAVAIAEPVRTPEQLLERARVERTLADLVIALAEPLRSTVLLRYREGLSAEAIATQQGVSVATVRRRLTEAVDLLRAGMDDREASKAWRAAFAPFLVAPKPRPPWGSLIMAKAGAKIALVAIALLLMLLGGGAVVHVLRRAPATSPPPAAPATSAVAASTRVAKVFAQPGLGTYQLKGRVTFGDQPFAGAKVRVTHAWSHEVLSEVDSASNGTFAIPNLPAAGLVVSASAPDKTAMPVTVDFRAPSARDRLIELRLVGCVHLRGIVSDGSGTPIAHARVAPDATQVPFAETDALGHYDLCTHAGPGLVRFAASGYHSMLATLHLAGSDNLDVTLLPEAIVAGHVVDMSNAPVADAIITIDPRGKFDIRDAPAIAHSGADGTFRIPNVSPGRSEIYAEAPGMASRRVDIVLGTGETREGVVLRLEHAPRLSGHVLDSQGKPASGATIGLRVGSGLREGLAVTQADGSFMIERAPKGELGIVIPHFTVVTPHTIAVADKDVTVDITADALPAITGVVTRGGIPVADAYLQCPASRRSTEPPPTTDRTGTFSCPLASEGPFNVSAADAEGRFGIVEGTWTRGQTLAPITIELDQAGAICGTVSDADGKPLRGIMIHAQNPLIDDYGEATSDDAGNYCVRSLRNEGTFDLSAWLGGQQIPPTSPLPRVTLVKGQATQPIVLAAPDQEIAGTVVDDAGAPVPDVAVRVSAGKYFSDHADVVVSDANGHFAIQHLASGNYGVLATARDGASSRVDSVAAGTRDLRIQLASAGSIEGVLVGFRTQPSIIGVPQTGGHEPIDFETDADHFRAHGLNPGIYIVTAATNGHEGDNKTVTVKAGAVATMTLTSRGTANVSGHVIDWMTKHPVTSARCAPPYPRNGSELGQFIGSPETEVAVDPSGGFHFDDVTAGEVSIPCSTAATFGLRLATIDPSSHAQFDVFIVTPKSGGGDIGIVNWGTHAMYKVQPNAAKAGLQPGDVVTALDGDSVELLDGNAIRNAISTHPIGSSISLTVQRGKVTLTLSITL